MSTVAQPTPRLTIHTRSGGDKGIVVTGENLHIDVDFDDVDHIAVARDIGLVVDACNSFDALTEANKKLVALVERYASECGECGGKGYVYDDEAITGHGPDDVIPNRISCVECEDIRDALKETP